MTETNLYTLIRRHKKVAFLKQKDGVGTPIFPKIKTSLSRGEVMMQGHLYLFDQSIPYEFIWLGSWSDGVYVILEDTHADVTDAALSALYPEYDVVWVDDLPPMCMQYAMMTVLWSAHQQYLPQE